MVKISFNKYKKKYFEKMYTFIYIYIVVCIKKSKKKQLEVDIEETNNSPETLTNNAMEVIKDNDQFVDGI